MIQSNQNININTYKYCLKCGQPITEGSFCDFECRRDYYLEMCQDLDDLFGEWSGRD